jgi:hypothetical protein
MRDSAHPGWQQWRVALVREETVTVTPARFTRPVLAPVAAEEPGPDGVRRALVARVRRAIEAGHYDTDDAWLLAEEKLLRDAERGR